MRAPLEEARGIGQADIVVGIPFYDEADTIGHVLATAREGLRDFYPHKTSVVVCVVPRYFFSAFGW